MVSPLGPEHLERINQALEAADALNELLFKAKEADLELGDRPERLEATVKKLRGIKQAFFPNG